MARGHPTGAGAPCWRTTLLAKSSMLDLLRPPGRERGCAGQHGHFPVPAERRISAGGAAGGYPQFVLRRRGEAELPGRKRATHPPQRRASIPPRQLQAHIVQRLTLRVLVVEAEAVLDIAPLPRLDAAQRHVQFLKTFPLQV